MNSRLRKSMHRTGNYGCVWLFCGISFLAGCAVGPNYSRPVVDSPASFRGEAAAANAAMGEVAWWQLYADPTLQTLIREALTNNLDLRAAVARVEQARAFAVQARAQFIPSVGCNGTVGRGRNYLFGSAFPDNASTVNSAVATLNAFWEVDLWGRVWRLNESARAQLLASEEARWGVLLSLLSDVATENQLCVLLGRNPGPIPRSNSLLTQAAPEIPPGLPSALLERRPDVRQAEELLRSANAQVGVSVAEFFPKIGLTALLGRVSPELSAFTLGGANAWGIAAEASGPLFEGGRLVGQYRQAKAARTEAELRYRLTVLDAFREVSDALIARAQLAEIRQHQAREVTALETAVKLSTERYPAGKAGYYEVLETQQQLFPAQLNLAHNQRDQLLAVVTLYKGLGGGWQNETNSDPHP